MQELRIDELTGTNAIVAPGRATRPVVFSPAAAAASATPPDSCPFCAGHEAMTPPEVARVGSGEPNTPGWQVRVVPNLYPIVGAAADGMSGAHEVLVLSPAHDRQLDGLSIDGAVAVVRTFRDRAAYQLDHGFVHAQPLVNQGRPAGASIEHPHAQLVALSFTPPHVDHLLERFTNAGHDLVVSDIRGARDMKCFVREAEAITWCPPGGATPYVIRIAFPSPGARFDRATDEEVRALTEALQDALTRLHSTLGEIPYNIVIHTAPRDDPRPFHWWLEIVPRLGVYAGFEMGTGLWVNAVPPETAASLLRDA